MPHSEVVALVAGGVDFGEADRIVHLLTAQGAIEAFAHGAKKSKRRFAGALEPFTTIDASLTESKKRKGGLLTLDGATARQVRIGIRSDLTCIALASYVVELGLKTAPHGQDCLPQFELTVDALDLLNAGPATGALRRAYELRLLVALGFGPELSMCIQCGEEPARTYLDFRAGGLLCGAHRGAAPEVGPKTLAWMRAVLEAPQLDADAGHPREWADRAALALTRPLSQMWSDLLERPLKSQAMLESVL